MCADLKRGPKMSAATIVTLIGVTATFIVSALSLIFQRNQAFKQLQLVSSGQITDRFSKAIEHLGHSSPEIRIGGVFSLERIAIDSPAYVPHIVATLAAFVRNALPASKAGNNELIPVLNERAPDVHAALTALCRSPLSDKRPGSGEFGGLDLSRTDLRRSSLRGAQLYSANLFDSRLDGADLRHANLRDSNIGSANFSKFVLNNPEFEYGADLRHADLTDTRTNGNTNFDHARQDPAGPTSTPYATCQTCNPRGTPPPSLQPQPRAVNAGTPDLPAHQQK
jgi:hypothetical protein